MNDSEEISPSIKKYNSMKEDIKWKIVQTNLLSLPVFRAEMNTQRKRAQKRKHTVLANLRIF